MTYTVQPAVIGCAMLPRVGTDRESLEELQYRVARMALADAGLAITDIDGIVAAGNDQLDGRAISMMAASGSIGGVDRDIVSTPSSAEHGFVLGALRIATGLYNTQLVVAWSPTETAQLHEVERLGADPYFSRRLPLDELSASALQAVALEHAVPGVRAAAMQLRDANIAHGAKAYPDFPAPALGDGFTRWPLRTGMTGAPATGLIALVLAGAPEVERRKIVDPVWIAGMGWAVEASLLNDRDLTTVPSLVEAVRQCYAEAGITDPASQFDLAEVADSTPYQQLLALEALGLLPRGNWASGTPAIPVNRSGGSVIANPLFCAGLLRVGEIVQQLRGRAGAHQVAGARRGVAHAASGFAMHYNTVVVLDRAKPGSVA